MEAHVRKRRPEEFLQALLPAIHAAGDAAMKLWRSDSRVMTKPDGSPVTAADLECNRLLCEACEELDADIPILSEENNRSLRASDGSAFVIDPLDGTKEFIAGNKDFTINVALVEDGVPRSAILFAPAHHRLFFADGRGRAFEEDSDGRRRQLLPVRQSERAPRIVVSRSHFDERTRGLLMKLAPKSVHLLGSSLKFALLATGEADLYPRLSPTMTWDCAAGQALLSAVGGLVLKLDGSQPRYGIGGDQVIDAFVAGASRKRILAAIEVATSAVIVGESTNEAL
ncbi:3'(2'),5'-bisphosphate nucleotidase CysQ [Rhizobium sp. 2YAF20]|uniref:3'(2'),5'-bisphosphate nucleotidase CysQ family protein n=1 Tax=Rhizobium sp. 2YAF20 TaxID=3233027 RepID=UPI003F9C572D